MARELFYWDANAFSGFLNGEPDKFGPCQGVLEQARSGHILIVTSALTIAEVLFVRDGPKLPPTKREKVEKFFRADYISVKAVTRAIAEKARDVFWDNSILPKDALHVAT
ncbi:MAG: type II toxin-antitoxin system VapC family toxin, partial [Sulfobacillus sp.]